MERAEAMVWDEIERMQRETVNDHELQKVKNRYRFTQVTEYLKNPDIGSRMSRYEAFYGWDFFPEFDRRIKAVTTRQVQSVMQKYLQRHHVTIGYLQPSEGKRKPSRQVPEGEEQPSGDPQPEVGWKEVWNYLNPPPPVVPGIPAARQTTGIVRPRPIAPQVHKMALDNGIPLYAIENHLAPAVFLGGLIETGNMPEANLVGKPGISTLLTDVMNRGTETKGYDELSERMAFVPFTFSVNGSTRSFSFQGYALNEDAREMMNVGFEMVTRPGLREKDIETLRRRHIISARERFKKTAMVAFYHMFNTIFRDHPYSQTNSTEASLQSITRDDLQQLHGRYFRPDRTTLVVMGDMTPEAMRTLVNTHFGGWSASGEPPP